MKSPFSDALAQSAGLPESVFQLMSLHQQVQACFLPLASQAVPFMEVPSAATVRSRLVAGYCFLSSLRQIDALPSSLVEIKAEHFHLVFRAWDRTSMSKPETESMLGLLDWLFEACCTHEESPYERDRGEVCH